MTYIVIGVLLALAAFFSSTAPRLKPAGTGKRACRPRGSLGGAIWAYVSGLFHSAPPV
jgi:hypothetical protein